MFGFEHFQQTNSVCIYANAFALNVSRIFYVPQKSIGKSTFFVNHEKTTTTTYFFNGCPVSLIKVDLVEMNRSFTLSR